MYNMERGTSYGRRESLRRTTAVSCIRANTRSFTGTGKLDEQNRHVKVV
jgi:hypothetical protein